MDDEVTKEFARFTAKIREARASEVAFLGAIYEALRVAHVHRDWEMVRGLMRIIDTLANDLSEIDNEAS